MMSEVFCPLVFRTFWALSLIFSKPAGKVPQIFEQHSELTEHFFKMLKNQNTSFNSVSIKQRRTVKIILTIGLKKDKNSLEVGYIILDSVEKKRLFFTKLISGISQKTANFGSIWLDLCQTLTSHYYHSQQVILDR